VSFFSIALYCISFLFLSCIVLLYNALFYLFSFSIFSFLAGYKFNKLNLNLKTTASVVVCTAIQLVILHIFLFFFFLSGNAVLQLHTDVFTYLQHCCYVVVCRFVRSLMAFVCQEIKGLLNYLLISVLTNHLRSLWRQRVIKGCFNIDLRCISVCESAQIFPSLCLQTFSLSVSRVAPKIFMKFRWNVAECCLSNGLNLASPLAPKLFTLSSSPTLNLSSFSSTLFVPENVTFRLRGFFSNNYLSGK